MIEGLKIWVINVTTAIFFITAVEMILPSNSMRKYAKFVLGLILITVIISPLIKVFNGNLKLDNYISEVTKSLESRKNKGDYEKYRDISINRTTKVFTNNLESLCIQKLKDKYKKDKFNVSIKANYSDKDNELHINKILIGISEGKVNKVRKIIVKEKNVINNKEDLNDKKSKDIIDYITKIVNTSKDKIEIYRI